MCCIECCSNAHRVGAGRGDRRRKPRRGGGSRGEQSVASGLAGLSPTRQQARPKNALGSPRTQAPEPWPAKGVARRLDPRSRRRASSGPAGTRGPAPGTAGERPGPRVRPGGRVTGRPLVAHRVRVAGAAPLDGSGRAGSFLTAQPAGRRRRLLAWTGGVRGRQVHVSQATTGVSPAPRAGGRRRRRRGLSAGGDLLRHGGRRSTPGARHGGCDPRHRRAVRLTPGEPTRGARDGRTRAEEIAGVAVRALRTVVGVLVHTADVVVDLLACREERRRRRARRPHALRKQPRT